MDQLGFRRTQSLRYPKGSPVSNGLSRRGSRACRSRSSRKMVESQSSIARLTSNQRQALAHSWRILKNQLPALTRRIFSELEVVCPKVKDIFYKASLVDCFVNKEPPIQATLDEHVKYFTKFFDEIIINIDCEMAVTTMIRRCGQSHAVLNQSCGFNAEIWERLGEIIMERISTADAVQKTREAGRAWRTLIAFITDELRCSFDGEAKIFSRRSSLDHGQQEENCVAATEDLNNRLKELRSSSNVPTPKQQHFDEFHLSYPDFLQSPVVNRRDPLMRKLMHADMLERRLNLDIPEFYVGSIVAITISDPNVQNRRNRFLGICVRREREGLHSQCTLRNVINGLGVEIMYDLYNPTVLKIEVIKLERRLDDDLTYLVDALPEYSTFDFNMEPIAHPVGSPVPINQLKVKLRPPPWSRRWEFYDYRGIEDSWSLATPWYKRKFYSIRFEEFFKYDLVRWYRNERPSLEHELMVEKDIIDFETKRQQEGGTKRKILRSAANSAS
ncbi:39S ribosomal protein L19, mitochondrial [Aphelenchoides bicaudatus]|nr:39S ribosomal protein L19, mitochondrial [Aphelenchoides bicaudatus]